MPVLQLEAQVSATDLLKAVGQLEMSELDSFVSQVIDLRARRSAPNLPWREAELLQLINQGLPLGLWQRYEVLLAKRDHENLTDVEDEELLQLTDRIEELDAQRLEWLVELARLRGKSLTTVMADLGLKTPQRD